MKVHLRTLLALLAGLVLASCNRNGGLKITPQFNEEIERWQNLTFTFSKDICPDSLLNRWDTLSVISITPSVKGSFKWNTAGELVFSPLNGFKPGVHYTATVPGGVIHLGGKDYATDQATIAFHTPDLRVEETHVHWTRGTQGNNALIQVDLTFNYDINTTDANKKITFSSKGNRIITSAPASGMNKTFSVQMEPLTSQDEAVPLTIQVGNNLQLASGEEMPASDTNLNVEVPSRFNLTVTNVTAEHTGSQGIVTVSTSQPLLEAGLKEAIRLEPAVPFVVTLTDGGCLISSNQFSATTTYQLYLDRRVEGAFGGKLKANFEEQVHFGKIPPSITFMSNKGMYLSSAGLKNVALRIVNVPKVQVWITKIYENNLEQLMRDGIRDRYDYNEDDDQGFEYQSYTTENLGDTIFNRTYSTDKLPKDNEVSLLHLDFSDKLKSYDGVYIVTVASTDNKWVQHSKLISLSDIGLIVKEDRDNMYVFANSIRNATPLSNVKISFISNTNQRAYVTETDGEGMAVLKDISKNGKGFHIAMVSAKKSDEFSFVWLDNARVETSRFDVGGRSPGPGGLNAWLYPERNLYRPGETINISAIVRTELWSNPGSMPVKMRLVMPNGKEFAAHRHVLNGEGSCATSFALPPTALSGTYSVQLYSGNDVLLNSYDISVENFMPDRIKVQLHTDKPEYYTGDSIVANIQADNLFGTPAAGRKYECVLDIGRVDFTHEAYTDYTFNISNRGQIDFPFKSGSTAANGSAQEGFRVPATLTNCGIYKGNLTTTVFDETGRPVHRYQPITIHTQKVFIGINTLTDYFTTGTPATIKMVSVDKNGKLQSNVPAHLELVRKEWNTVIEQEYGRFKYVSHQTEKVVDARDVQLMGNYTYRAVPALSGEYELRAWLAGTDHYVSYTFYAYGFANTSYSSFEVNNEGNVTIKAGKGKYKKGDNIDLLFTTPFEGRMLVTVERDKIMKHYYLNTRNRSASLTLKADDALVPNVYISATLFRAMTPGDLPLTVAHGIISVPVENPDNHLPLAITVAEKIRSKTKQTITVKTTPGAFVTIAAVDEGILQVKNFETPDIYHYFYQKVALSTNSYDIYPLLLPELATRRTSTGGDGADQSSMRANPLFVNRVKNVSFWSGILQANGSGVVQYTVDVPQFSGDLRVMAVAYKGKAMASADRHVKVADPI
ncbi:MAG: alpha-2-macroglobulin family protein, partial [Chitinophagia bacterium]|nr:alpha-2-macroglobulin family protein [Chitinophagia bacterium]